MLRVYDDVLEIIRAVAPLVHELRKRSPNLRESAPSRVAILRNLGRARRLYRFTSWDRLRTQPRRASIG